MTLCVRSFRTQISKSEIRKIFRQGLGILSNVGCSWVISGYLDGLPPRAGRIQEREFTAVLQTRRFPARNIGRLRQHRSLLRSPCGGGAGGNSALYEAEVPCVAAVLLLRPFHIAVAGDWCTLRIVGRSLSVCSSLTGRIWVLPVYVSVCSPCCWIQNANAGLGRSPPKRVVRFSSARENPQSGRRTEM